MKDNKRKKIGVAAVSASVLTAGTIAFAAAYQSGTSFDPSGSNRELQMNQVVFSDDDTVSHKKDNDKNESKMLQKDQNQDNQSGAKSRSQANYLFDSNMRMADNSENSAMINDGNNNDSSGNLLDNVAQTPGSKPGTILDITGDASNADVIINGNGAGGNTGVNGGGNGGNGANGNGGNGNGGNGNGNQGGNTGSSVKKDPPTKKAPADSTFTNRPYTEGSVANKDRIVVQFLQSVNEDSSLYMGQLIDETRVYNSLDTYVLGFKDDEIIRYNWDESALGKYVRIDGVSFDGGKTWKSNFPMTIPTEVNEDMMLVKASYRMSEKDAWQTYVNPNNEEEAFIYYSLKPACVYVLSEPLSDDSDTIEEDKILSLSSQRYPTSDKLNLFQFTGGLLKSRGLCDTDDSGNPTTVHALVPGWTEDGKKVPWVYPVTKGRHILEPVDVVPVSEGYTVAMKSYWMTDDYKVDFWADNYYSLQTMTNYEKPSLLGDEISKQEYREVQVPEYVQAVDIDDDADMSVEYLSLSDTVLYLNESSQGLTVNRGYLVDENNLNYAATEEGVLTNKEGNEYLVIPAKISDITVTEDVTKVNLSGNNRVSTLNIEAESSEQIPEIVIDKTDNFGESLGTKGQNCQVIVKDAVLNDFTQMYFEQFINKNASTGLTNFNGIAAEENPELVYQVNANGFVIGNKHLLRQVVNTGRSVATISSNIQTIEEQAFSGADAIRRLMMPENGTVVKLEKDCFAGSALKTIGCYSQEQYDYITEHLEESGAPEDVQVEMVELKQSKEGFGYYEEVDDEATSYVLAVVPENLISFDGAFTAEDGTSHTFTEISDNAFSECKELEWVELPESVKRIGYEAFYGCSSLQGVLIDSKDSIYIGNKSFDQCGSMRFIASNAMTAEMQDGYDPIVAQTYGNTQFTYFYAPTGSSGYGDHALAFTEESGVTAYSMIDISDGCKMLFGMNEENQAWLGIRSGTNVGENVTLPEEVLELYSYSMAGIESSAGTYQLNWDDLWRLQYFDEGVFFDSDLGGDIALNQDSSYIYDYTFASTKLTNFQVNGLLTYLGHMVFQECGQLQSVTLGSSEKDVYLSSNLFYGCQALRTLTLNNSNASYAEYALSMQEDSPFQFNTQWTQEEEWNTLHINIPDDPENFYIKKWRYYVAGYKEEYRDGEISITPYLNMWESLYYDYLNENGTYPTYEQIDAELEEKLLAAENGIRKMMGKEMVDEPTNFYPYRKEGNEITLIGAPSNIDHAFLYADMMEFPEGWSVDYIASGAFSKSKNLESLAFVDNLAGMYPNIFKGVESDTLTMRFWTETVPQLILDEEGVPYEFGIDNSKIKLEVNDGMGEAYINGWSYPLAGYTDRSSMETAVKEELTQKDGSEPTDEELKAEVDKQILPYMNIIRGWLGLDPVDTIDDVATGTEPSEPEEPDTPDESGDVQSPDQSSESDANGGTGDSEISGDSPDNAGDSASDSQTDVDQDDNGQESKENGSSENKEQDGSVKKDESDSGSQK